MNEKEKNSDERSEEQTPPVNIPASNDAKENTAENILQPVTDNDQQPPGANEPKQDSSSAHTDETNAGQNTSQPLTENMEIHHHPHVHHTKKWKNYLYEFLMLFLAITAGFFVENKRESYIERHRADQFSRQLLADLRLDSQMLENRNRDIQNMQKGYDSLFYLLTKKTGASAREILEVLLPVTYVFDVPATTTTYNQMKTSGSLRYIENTNITAHLQHYYDVLLPRSTKIADACLDYFSRNINPFYLRHIRIQDYDPFNDTLVNKDPILLEWSAQTNQELANIMGGYRSLLKILAVAMNAPALEKLKETMLILRQEYDLE